MRRAHLRLPTCLAALICLGALALAAPADAQTRRALLIGVGTYAKAPENRTPARRIRDLGGPVNDVDAVRSLLVTRYGFEGAHVRTLLDGAATRQGILGSLDSLVRVSAAGDEIVVFYAGHGSQVRNDASQEADRLDETLVPADAPLGTPDVRDKELRTRFAAIAARGARLTVIVDACHSGSIARGLILGDTRYTDPSPLVISDGSSGPSPESMPGVLILSAAQDTERAQEIVDKGRPSGAFTTALVAALVEGPPTQSVSDVFLRARARMKGLGLAQEPVVAGDPSRRSGSLFGAAKDGAAPGLLLPVSSVRRGQTLVEGGVAVGLTPGSQLACVTSTGTDTVRVVVAETVGLGQSRLTLPAGMTLAPGDLCRIAALAPDAAAPLQVWIPPTLPSSQRGAVAALDSLLKATGRPERVRDPVARPPTHVVWWNGRTWQVRRGGERPQEFRPTADGVRRVLPGSADVFVVGAPEASVRAALVAGLVTRGVGVVAEPQLADYWLDVQGPRAAWLRASGDAESLVPQRTAPVAAARAADVGGLVEQASALARVWAWHHVASPADGAVAFPYRLVAWENAATGTRQALDVPLEAHSTYRAVLELPAEEAATAAARAATGELQARYVYLFALDAAGNGDLLFPLSEFGQVENRLSPAAGPSLRVPTATDQYLFTTGEAGNRDLLVVLTTLDPLPDPSVLTFRSGTTRAASPRNTTPLGRLLFGVGEATRSTDAVPATWSVQRVPLVVGR